MDELPEGGDAARIAALEAAVRSLTARLALLESQRAAGQYAPPQYPPPQYPPPQYPPVPGYSPQTGQAEPVDPSLDAQQPGQYAPYIPNQHAAATQAPAEPAKPPLSASDWVSRIGIALLIAGCAFLFKYSIDQGWIGNAAKVGFGYGLGTILLGLGWKLGEKRPAYADVLFGGGAALFHLTFFAAHEMYGMISVMAALVGTLVVDVFAVAEAFRRNRSVPAVLGIAGAFANPFLLGLATEPSLFAMVYFSGLFVMIGVIALAKPWADVLATGTLGAIVVLAATNAEFGGPVVVVAWLCVGAVPLLRAFAQTPPVRDQFAVVAAAFFPFPMALWFYEYSGHAVVPFAVGGGLLVLAALLHLRERGLVAGALTAALHTTVAACLCVKPTLGLVAAAATCLVAQLAVTRGLRMRVVHVGWFIVTLLGVVATILEYEPPIETLHAELAIAAAMVMLLASLLVGRRTEPERDVFGVAVFLQAVVFLWVAVDVGFVFGPGAVTLVWGIFAVAEVGFGGVTGNKRLLSLGYLSLAIVVGKLVFYDTAALATIWRILLFLGFGVVLLGLGYMVPKLAERHDESA